MMEWHLFQPWILVLVVAIAVVGIVSVYKTYWTENKWMFFYHTFVVILMSVVLAIILYLLTNINWLRENCMEKSNLSILKSFL